MKFIIILIFLLQSCSIKKISEDWIKVSESASKNDFDLYVNYNSLKKSKNISEMWDFRDFKKPQVFSVSITKKSLNKSDDYYEESYDEKLSNKNIIITNRYYLSSMVKNEFNCLNETKRVVALSRYENKLAKGDVVFSNMNINGLWNTISPGSAGEILWKVACGKFKIDSFQKKSPTFLEKFFLFRE